MRITLLVLLSLTLLLRLPSAVLAAEDLPFFLDEYWDSLELVEDGIDGLEGQLAVRREEGASSFERLGAQAEVLSTWADDLLLACKILSRHPHVCTSPCADCRRSLWDARDRSLMARSRLAGFRQRVAEGSPFPAPARSVPPPSPFPYRKGMRYAVDLRERVDGSMTFTESCTLTVDRLGDDVMGTSSFRSGDQVPWCSERRFRWLEEVGRTVGGLPLTVFRTIRSAELEEDSQGSPLQGLTRPGSLAQAGERFEVLFLPGISLIRLEGQAYLERDSELLAGLSIPLDFCELLPGPIRSRRRWILSGSSAGELVGMEASDEARAVLSVEELTPGPSSKEIVARIEGQFRIPLKEKGGRVILRGQLEMKLLPKARLPLRYRMEGETTGMRELETGFREGEKVPYRWKGKWLRELELKRLPSP